MTNSQKKIATVIVILVLCGAFAFGLVARSRQQAAAEAEARKTLSALGALVTMDSNQQHIHGIALLPTTKRENLKKTIQLAADLPHLEVLRLAGTCVTDELLARIADNSSLTMLGLNNTDISDTGLEHLRNLDNLVALYLDGTQVTDHGLKYLGQLRKLEILDLSDTRLEGDLAALLPLDRLNHLLLAGVGLNGDAANNLMQLKSLSRLGIRGKGVSDEVVSKLEQAGIQVDRADEESPEEERAEEEDRAEEDSEPNDGGASGQTDSESAGEPE